MVGQIYSQLGHPEGRGLMQGCGGLAGRRRGCFLEMLAVADACGAKDDQNDSDPPQPGHGFAQKYHGCNCGEYEAKTGERPEKADVTFGH